VWPTPSSSFYGPRYCPHQRRPCRRDARSAVLEYRHGVVRAAKLEFTLPDRHCPRQRVDQGTKCLRWRALGAAVDGTGSARIVAGSRVYFISRRRSALACQPAWQSRTGLCPFSNRSPGVGNGNWKNRGRGGCLKRARFGSNLRQSARQRLSLRVITRGNIGASLTMGIHITET
jgi:hypothetical protein